MVNDNPLSALELVFDIRADDAPGPGSRPGVDTSTQTTRPPRSQAVEPIAAVTGSLPPFGG